MDGVGKQRSDSDTRKRSRSPYREHRSPRDVKKRRSRSPRRHKHHRSSAVITALPFRRTQLSRHDFDGYRSLFADYLDLQKQLDIDGLDETEVKGRWKSFLGKWNRGELAEGWYDPDTKRKADERYLESSRVKEPSQSALNPTNAGDVHGPDSEYDGYGPNLPSSTDGKRIGPAVPSLEDLQHRQELSEGDREDQRADLRYERTQDRLLQKERLEELVPRAAPGSRERQIEKKREAAASNKSFAEGKEAGTEEVGEGELMGDDGIEGFKAKRKAMEKQKNERQLKKEEVWRAKAAEREERMREHRAKEEKTMETLRQIARQRFGGGE